MMRATVLAIVLVSTSLLVPAQDGAVLSGHSEEQQDTLASGALRNKSLRTQRTTTPIFNKSPATSLSLLFRQAQLPQQPTVSRVSAQRIKIRQDLQQREDLSFAFVISTVEPVEGIVLVTQPGI